MKKFRKIGLCLLTAVCALALALGIAACGGKTETYSLILDLDGGTIEGSTTLQLEGGANVFDAVKDLTPVKDDFIFIGWYEGDSPLSEDRTMPEENLTLKAGWAAETGTTVRYDANAPRGTSPRGDTPVTVLPKDGSGKVAECGFSVEGYRFAGWGTSANGAVSYVAGADISSETDLTLYALWDRGYPDRFGGGDYIFFPRGTTSEAILWRGGMEFTGNRTGKDFSFALPGGGTLAGRVFGSEFAYAHAENKATYVYYNSYYNPDDPDGSDALDETDTLAVDEYGTAVHSYVNEAGVPATDTGVISYNAFSEEYIFTITEGANRGGGFAYFVGRVDPDGVDDNDPSDDIFTYSSSWGEAGEYVEFLTPDGNIGSYGYGSIVLDGYGGATYHDFFNGAYYVKNLFGNASSNLFIFMIHARFQDRNHQAQLLGITPDADGYFELEFYTLPMDNIGLNYAYVEPHVEVGEYVAKTGGDVLQLDGYGVFPDSAILTSEGVSRYGSYTVSALPSGQVYITVSENDAQTGLPTGRTFSYYLYEDATFDTRTGEEAQSYIELYYDTDLQGGAFGYRPVLSIGSEDYSDGEGNVLGKKAELYWATKTGLDFDGTFNKVADGYVTAEVQQGGVTWYTFTRTALTPGADGTKIEKRMLFLLDETFDGSNAAREVFYVFEREFEDETVKVYTTITSADGEEEIWYADFGIGGVGTLYFAADGTVYSGGLTVNTTDYYFGNVGIFSYIDYEANVIGYFYFELELDASGQPAIFTPVSELEYPVYHFQSNGTLFTDAPLLIVRGEEAIYSPSGFSEDANDRVRGTLVFKNETQFGDTVYSFVSRDGVTLFDLVMMGYDFWEMGTVTPITVYYSYNSAVAGTYTSADGGSLTLDGFSYAHYSDGRTTIDAQYAMPASDVVSLQGVGGTYLFHLTGNTFEQYDSMYGSYSGTIGREGYTFRFDGKGNVEAYQGNLRVGNGIYDLIGENEVTIYIDFGMYGEGDGIVSYTLRAVRGELVLLNEKVKGVYVSDDWAVLSIDGYGSGRYYAADGSVGVTVYYDVPDSESGYLALRSENYDYFNYVVDNTTGKMRAPNAVAREEVYYGDDFSPLIFEPDGSCYYLDGSGFYDIVGEEAHLFIQLGQTLAFTKIVLPKPTASDVYETDERMYYLYHAGREVVFHGKVTVDMGEEGGSKQYDATLSFTPDGMEQFYANARFTVTEENITETFTLQVINRYWDYTLGRRRGLALYESASYSYSPITEYTYDPVNGSTFNVVGGAQTSAMHDGFEDDSESVISESYVGFGPIHLSETVVSGSIKTNDGKLTFTDGTVTAVEYSDASLGARYLAVFTSDGQKYAVMYHKMDGDYQLYALCTYSEIETEKFTVGVCKYVYSNEGFTFYGDPAQGDFIYAVLYEKGSLGKGTILTYNSGTYAGGEEVPTAWCIALGTYDPMSETGSLGKGYFITFDEGLTSAVVEEYASVKQGIVDNMTAFVNFFLDEEGNVARAAAIALSDGETYRYVTYFSSEKTEEGTWVFHAVNGFDYTVTLVMGEDGLPEESEEYWVVGITETQHVSP